MSRMKKSLSAKASSIPEDERAMQSALRALGYRSRSEHELRQRLELRGYSARVIDQTLAKLARLGLLDDREFTRNWIASRAGLGPIRLKQELRQKGIDRDLAEQLITTGISTEDEWASARQVAVRAVQRYARPLSREDLLRVRRLLLRRGFSGEIAGRVCARLPDHLTVEGDWLE